MLIFQFFQNFGIGGIAGFRFLYRRQVQFLKQQFSQLLGGIDVKGLAGIGLDQSFAIGNTLRQHLTEAGQHLPVNCHTGTFHSVKNRAKRQLHLTV